MGRVALALMLGALSCAAPLEAQAREDAVAIEEDIQPNTPMAEPIHYVARGKPEDLRRLAAFARSVGFRIGRMTREQDGTSSLKLRAPAGMTYGDAAGVEEAVWEHEFGEATTLEGIPAP
jgi:hypothetical protein